MAQQAVVPFSYKDIEFYFDSILVSGRLPTPFHLYPPCEKAYGLSVIKSVFVLSEAIPNISVSDCCRPKQADSL